MRYLITQVWSISFYKMVSWPSCKKQKLDDPAYEVVQWALANQQYLFRLFFPGCDATKLEHEMQYPVKQLKGANPNSNAFSNPTFSQTHLGFIDLVLYNNTYCAHPDQRIEHREGAKHVECLYIKVEAELPQMDELMRRLQKYHLWLGRVPKERIVLLAPRTPSADHIRQQGFGVVELPWATESDAFGERSEPV